MDNTTTYHKLGNHYFKSANQKVLLVIVSLIVVMGVLFAIAKYEDKLNAKYQTKQEKMEQVKKIIAEDTHIKRFHTQIVYEN